MLATFEHAALHYLDQWLLHEATLRGGLLESDVPGRLAAVREALTFFGVSRNLPVAHDVQRGLPRYGPVLKILDATPSPSPDGVNLVHIVEGLASGLGRAYGRAYLLSLASKLLWLRHRDPVLIYDARVRQSLECKAGDYRAYAAAWRDRFAANAEAVTAACGALPDARRLLRAAHLVDAAQVASIVREPWFQHRVFDIYLWCNGGKSAAPPA